MVVVSKNLNASSGFVLEPRMSFPIGNDEGSEFSEPQLAESDVSSDDEYSRSSFDDDVNDVNNINPVINFPSTPDKKEERDSLKWQFRGLTIWLEMEEFDMDLTKALRVSASSHGLKPIPKSHMTALYGMDHLSVEDARARLRSFVELSCPSWPLFGKPVGVVQDIAVNGNPGQVCDIAWAELTMPTNQEHEDALDLLYEVFYPDECSRPTRHRPWKPHNSIAYDNPENTVLTLGSIIGCIMKYPTILSKQRNVEAISLWDTNGTMDEWKCLERVYFKR